MKRLTSTRKGAMSESKPVTMGDVHEVTFEFLPKLTKLHNEFLKGRQNSDGCLVERVAIFCAYSIIAGAFDLKNISDDPEFLSAVNEYVASAIPALVTAPISELPSGSQKVGMA